jgi:hypothetical protein
MDYGSTKLNENVIKFGHKNFDPNFPISSFVS